MISKDKAEDLADALLQTARVVHPLQRPRPPINWIWMLTVMTVALWVMLDGMYAGNRLQLALGVAIAVAAAWGGARRIPWVTDTMENLGLTPLSLPAATVFRAIPALVVAGGIVYREFAPGALTRAANLQVGQAFLFGALEWTVIALLACAILNALIRAYRHRKPG